MLPEEPAGRICTALAGAVSLEAALSARPGRDLPAPILPDPGPGVRYRAIREDRDGGAQLRLSCEVRAVRPADLAAAVDGLLRALSAHAGLVEAVLETRLVRLRERVVPDALLVGRLARALRSSGLRVSFGPSWEPAPAEAAVCVGARGREREIELLLREHPAWQPVPL